MEIKYFNRENDQIEIEKVYGDSAVNWLYDSSTGKLLSNLLIKRPLSKVYGATQSSPFSRKKVVPFIKDFNIDMDEFVPTKGRNDDSPYASFNEFFIRRFREGARPFVTESKTMPAFCEARYFGYESLNTTVQIPVKGQYWQANELLDNNRWAPTFKNGPCLLARLCPVDYHRFHYPDDGQILDEYRIKGLFHSVNPLALRKEPRVFSLNERHVTVIDTKNFGKLAYVEVGAICVGKIIQSSPLTGTVKRGQEKGYFLFGGSTVIVLGEPGAWKPDQTILEHTAKSIEVYQKLGSAIAHC